MLYYATIILLHRPFYSSPSHHIQCRNASHCLEKLVIILDKTFGVTRLTYLIIYCIYTGASVIVQDVKAGDLEAKSKMETFLGALRGGVSTCPLVQRSIDIITNSTKPNSRGPDAAHLPDISHVNTSTGRYLPAFPFPETQSNFDHSLGSASMDLDAFTLLDCFPEDHTNITDAEWYLN
jgi:hypothetical protein